MPCSARMRARSRGRPSERTQAAFFRQVTVDPAAVRVAMGERWAASQAYGLQLARTPGSPCRPRSSGAAGTG